MQGYGRIAVPVQVLEARQDYESKRGQNVPSQSTAEQQTDQGCVLPLRP